MLCFGSFRERRPKDDEDSEETRLVRTGSLAASVYAANRRQKSTRRPATVLIVYPLGLDRTSSSSGSSTCTMRPLSSDLNTPRIDSYRFSMANMEESPDMDLDAILTELCALESQYDEAIQSASKSDVSSNKEEVKVTTGGRTHSPDNDSAFSDSVSLLSSESSASSGRTDLHTQVEGVSNTKADKIRLALQKMKDASVKKLFIKVFSGDGSGKSLLVDEGMSCGYVTRILAEKNHRQLDPQCALVESLTDLHMERVYEDHEPLVEQLMLWTRDSKNKLIFSDRPDERTLLFRAPHLFIGPSDAVPTNDQMANSEMLEEFFSGSGVPSVEGPLYIKTESRKGWKKYHCMLRASGLYYWPKDKAKSSSKDLVCLATFDVNHVYYGVGWKKKYKSPTEHCFAIKHPCLQQPKSVKYIKFLCAEDSVTMHRWVTAIRIIKYGRQILANYRSVVEECHLLANGGGLAEGVEDASSLHRHHLVVGSGTTGLGVSGGGSVGSGGRHDDSSDDGSSSDSSGCDVGFECDFPSGTIKRKPPKLPLTATTRQLKEIGATVAGATSVTPIATSPAVQLLHRVDSVDSLPPPPPELLADDTDELDTCDADEPPPPPPPPPRLPQPSAAFLQDLQRVMRRKWQVAQKCKADVTTSPHEVLGFRDPATPSVGGGHEILGGTVVPSSREADVSNWVAEHYGGSTAPDPRNTMRVDSRPSLYENVYRPAPNLAPLKKRPPPPPPPRALTTQLTTVVQHKC